MIYTRGTPTRSVLHSHHQGATICALLSYKY